MSGNGFRQPALLLQDQSKIVVTGRAIRPQRDLLEKQPFGTGEIALLRRDDGKVAIGSRIGGINAEDRSIKPLCFSHRAPALRCKALFQQLLRCRTFHEVVRSQAEDRGI